MEWKKTYQERLRTAKDAAMCVKDGDRVFGGSREAVAVLSELFRRQDLQDVTYYTGVINKPKVFFGEDGEQRSSIRIEVGFMNSETARFMDEGRMGFLPIHYSGRYKKTRTLMNADVAIVNVSAPNESGYVSFGTSADVAGEIASETPFVIAEINPKMPFVVGSNLMHISQFDVIVEGEGYAPGISEVDTSPNEIYDKVGGYLSELIEDGATLEIGIGRLNSAALWNLDSAKDLGIHTEIFGDVMLNWVKRGIVTNRKKTLDPDLNVCCMVVGSQELYDFAQNNPTLHMRNPNYIHNAAIIAQHHKMTAINNAINVDLLGQANAESLRGRQYSGMGGIGDFCRGATMCPTGKSIIVLESTTKNGKYSKIVPYFEPGTPVSVPRTDVEYVVTEYGVAKLAGATVPQRARELIKVAHPDFREELFQQAQKMGIL